MSTPIFLSDDALQALGITPSEVQEAIETALVAGRKGEISAAPKASVIAPDGRYMMATLSASDALGIIAVKSVMVNDRNKSRDLPGINGAIMILDAETGLLKAVIGANWVTAVRTAGLSAVAASRLANPEAQTIALIGTGVQAESHLRAFSSMFPLKTVLVHGRGAAGIAKTQAVAEGLSSAFEVCDPETCLRRADIVVSSVTLDYTIEPFLDARWLKPGAFAAITDLGIPWHDAGQSTFGRVYVDDLAQERAMEKPMVAPSLITGELADLAIGAPSYDAGSPSAFIFRGIAVGDLAVAGLAYARAVGD